MSESSRGSISRRAILKSALAAGAASLVPGEEPATAKTAKSAKSVKSANTANPQSDAITSADLATVDRVVGLEYSEPERTLMAKSLTELRGEIKAMRASSLPASTEPATHFDPRLPSTKAPTEKPGAKVSAGRTPAYDGRPESLAFATAVELGRLLKATPGGVEAAIARRVKVHR